MDGKLKSFLAIIILPSRAVMNLKPDDISWKDWFFAVDALVAMAED